MRINTQRSHEKIGHIFSRIEMNYKFEKRQQPRIKNQDSS